MHFCVQLIAQTIDQFELDGCENCEEYLHMKNNRDTVYECTSSSFDGFVILLLLLLNNNNNNYYYYY